MCLIINRGNFEFGPWTLFLVQWRFLVIICFYRGGELKFRYAKLPLKKETIFLLDSTLILEQ